MIYKNRDNFNLILRNELLELSNFRYVIVADSLRFHFNHIIKLKMAVILSNFFASDSRIASSKNRPYFSRYGCYEDLASLKNFAMRNCRRFFLFLASSPSSTREGFSLTFVRAYYYLYRPNSKRVIGVPGMSNGMQRSSFSPFLLFRLLLLRFFVSLFNPPCPLLGLGN